MQRRPGWRRGVLAFWMLVIFVTSCFHVTVGHFLHIVRHAGNPGFQAGFARFWDSYWWVFVKGWHAAEFAILLLFAAAATRWRGVRVDRAVLWSLAFVAVFAASDEWHQTFVPGRGGHFSDVCVDLGGACVAGLFLLLRRAPPA